MVAMSLIGVRACCKAAVMKTIRALVVLECSGRCRLVEVVICSVSGEIEQVPADIGATLFIQSLCHELQ